MKFRHNENAFVQNHLKKKKKLHYRNTLLLSNLTIWELETQVHLLHALRFCKHFCFLVEICSKQVTLSQLDLIIAH